MLQAKQYAKRAKQHVKKPPQQDSDWDTLEQQLPSKPKRQAQQDLDWDTLEQQLLPTKPKIHQQLQTKLPHQDWQFTQQSQKFKQNQQYLLNRLQHIQQQQVTGLSQQSWNKYFPTQTQIRKSQASVYASCIDNYLKNNTSCDLTRTQYDLNAIEYNTDRSSFLFLDAICQSLPHYKFFKKQIIINKGIYQVPIEVTCYRYHNRLILELGLSLETEDILTILRHIPHPDINQIIIPIGMSKFRTLNRTTQQPQSLGLRQRFLKYVISRANPNCGHNMLMYIDIKRKSIQCFDPLTNTRAIGLKDRRQLYVDDVKSALETIYETRFTKKDTICLRHQAINSKNCIVFTYIYAVYLLLGGTPSKLKGLFPLCRI